MQDSPHGLRIHLSLSVIELSNPAKHCVEKIIEGASVVLVGSVIVNLVEALAHADEVCELWVLANEGNFLAPGGFPIGRRA